MKKFLFTLAALLMAGSLCADEYFYVEPFEVAEGQTSLEVPVLAHFDHAVSAWMVEIQLPEGLVFDGEEMDAGEDMTIPYLDSRGRSKTFDSPLMQNIQPNFGRFIAANTINGYYEVDGSWEAYGPVKWLAGDYEEMFIIYLTVEDGFQGGDIVVTTQPSCGQENRPDVEPCPLGMTYTQTCTVTVEGGAQPEKTDAPVITVVDDPEAQTVTVTATGNGHICLYWDDVLQAEGEGEAVWVIPYGDEAEEYGVSATAQEDGKEVSDYALATVEVPQKTVVVEKTDAPVITVVDDPEAQTVTVTATGNGHICLYWDDQLMAEGEGTAEWVIPYGEDPEGEEYGVSATAQEEGKEVSDYALETVFVPGIPAGPVVTPTPEIIITPDADNMGYTIEVVGEGELHLYINGEEVENPYHIDRTDEAQTLVITATAQVEDMEISATAEKTFVVPAFAGEGIYIVLIDQEGNEHQYDLYASANNPNNFVTMVTLEYNPWGAFDPMYEERPNVPFYFIVNGERLGAENDMTPTKMGAMEETLQNPLFATDFCYTVPVGYTYTIGIQFTADGDMYVLCAQGSQVGVDELNADKAVAGVRYFNMAGQEMQEVNGATIVVTTYTDGTTSAVKVIK